MAMTWLQVARIASGHRPAFCRLGRLGDTGQSAGCSIVELSNLSRIITVHVGARYLESGCFQSQKCNMGMVWNSLDMGRCSHQQAAVLV